VAAVPSLAAPQEVNLQALFDASGAREVLRELEHELVGLAPVKGRIQEIAALLVVDRARAQLGLPAANPSLHMCFTGNPGTGKTTVARRMASMLYRLGYLRRDHLVAVSRDDLVGQWVGHTAPKTKEVLKKAMGGVLFVDEAYTLYRPDNERDYGQEAIEILLQEMEEHRDDLVVILAGYRTRMESFFQANPGLSSRVAHHVHFPDYRHEELLAIADRMLEDQRCELSPGAREAMQEYVRRRMGQPRFANARSIRNALERARLRQASRLLEAGVPVGREALVTLEAEDIRRSRVFTVAAEP